MNNRSVNQTDRFGWPHTVLVAAGLYNLLWGAAVILFPLAIFQWLEMPVPLYPQIWQCVGMIVGVYGIGYLIAANDPHRHWPIVLVGLLGKAFGPIGFLLTAWQGELPWSWGLVILTNDLIWWVPFAVILYRAARENSDTSRDHEFVDLPTALTRFASHRGSSLSSLSRRDPTLVVFLRHAGCIFCRETLFELQRLSGEFHKRNVNLAIVHMSDPLEATVMCSKYDLDHVHRYSDPECVLYRAFGVQRGALSELLGPTVWWRGFLSFLRGHAVGKLSGDGFRMPGCFVIHNDEILASYRSASAADHPDYLNFVDSALENLPATPVMQAATAT